MKDTERTLNEVTTALGLIEFGAQEREDAQRLANRAAVVIIADLDSHEIVYATPEADRMFGYIPGELRGKSVHTLVPDELVDAHVKDIKGYAGKPEDRQMASRIPELSGRRRDGSLIRLLISLTTGMVGRRRCAAANIFDLSAAENVGEKTGAFPVVKQ